LRVHLLALLKDGPCGGEKKLIRRSCGYWYLAQKLLRRWPLQGRENETRPEKKSMAPCAAV